MFVHRGKADLGEPGEDVCREPESALAKTDAAIGIFRSTGASRLVTEFEPAHLDQACPTIFTVQNVDEIPHGLTRL
jgi:hypothetical protein